MEVFDEKEAGTPGAADVPAMMCAVVGVLAWATEGDLQRFSRRKREPPTHLLPVDVGPGVRAIVINGLASGTQRRGGCRSDGDEPACRKHYGGHG